MCLCLVALAHQPFDAYPGIELTEYLVEPWTPADHCGFPDDNRCLRRGVACNPSRGHVSAAHLLCQRLADKRNSHAEGLNDLAWRVIDDPSSDLPELRYALLKAMLAGELVDQNNASLNTAILDTLALAYHRTGHTAKAIETQKKTLALMEAGSEYKNVFEERLATFEKALQDARHASQEQPPQ